MCSLFWGSLGQWFGMEEAVVYNYSYDVSFGRWCAPALPPNHISILCLSVSQFQSFQWFLFLWLCSAFRVFLSQQQHMWVLGSLRLVWKQCFTTLMSVRMSCAPSLHLITSPSSLWASFRAAFQFLHLFSQDFISIWKKPAGSYLLQQIVRYVHGDWFWEYLLCYVAGRILQSPLICLEAQSCHWIQIISHYCGCCGPNPSLQTEWQVGFFWYLGSIQAPHNTMLFPVSLFRIVLFPTEKLAPPWTIFVQTWVPVKLLCWIFVSEIACKAMNDQKSEIQMNQLD